MGKRLALILFLLLINSASAFAKPREDQWKEAEQDRQNTTTMIDQMGTVHEVPDDQVDGFKQLGYKIETKAEYEARMIRLAPDAAMPATVNVITPEGDVGSIPSENLNAALREGFTVETDQQANERIARQAAEEQGPSISSGEIIMVLFGGAIVAVVLASWLGKKKG